MNQFVRLFIRNLSLFLAVFLSVYLSDSLSASLSVCFCLHIYYLPGTGFRSIPEFIGVNRSLPKLIMRNQKFSMRYQKFTVRNQKLSGKLPVSHSKLR